LFSDWFESQRGEIRYEASGFRFASTGPRSLDATHDTTCTEIDRHRTRDSHEKTKDTYTRVEVCENIALALQMIAANGNVPSPEAVRDLTGYSKATVNRHYPSQVGDGAHQVNSSSVIESGETEVPGSNDFVIRLGWPKGNGLPAKVTIFFG
jgi:hypothetical protein